MSFFFIKLKLLINQYTDQNNKYFLVCENKMTFLCNKKMFIKRDLFDKL